MEESKKIEKNNASGSTDYKKRKKVRLVGKILLLLQLVLLGMLLIFIGLTGVLAGKYMALVGLALAALFAILCATQFICHKTWMKVTASFISLLFCVGLGFGNYYIAKTNHIMGQVAGATFKTDNMVVVVRADDPAKELLDAKRYQFGKQTAVDQDNTNKMIVDINAHLKNDISIATYDTIEDMANALLDGKIEAAIYNQALVDTVEESVPGFANKVKIIYSYGIQTNMEIKKPQDVEKKSFNVLISGMDVAGSISTTSRSDVNIIATVNLETKQVLLTTTPRDYYVPLTDVSGGVRDKLTHAGIYGVQISMATLGTLYDIELDYYVRVNFTTLIKVVDLLGGIDVQSEYDFTVGKHHFLKGINHLDGEKALIFSRERYSFQDGDNQRGKNQEKVLTAIIEKALAPDVLLKADQLLNAMSESFETNMGKVQMGDLIRGQLSDRAPWSIESVAATGTGSSEYTYTYPRQKLYVMKPDQNSIATIQQKMDEIEAGKSLSK